MANLITSMDEMDICLSELDARKDSDEGKTGNYVSHLANYCVTSSNMKFDSAGSPTKATLLILESKREKCYTLAYATDMGEYSELIVSQLDSVLEKSSYLKLGTGSVDASGNISLTLTPTGATKKLSFANQNIVNITDSSGDDVIYIDTQGVAKKAELNFSTGADAIIFNGATTVQNISGGVRREYTFSSA